MRGEFPAMRFSPALPLLSSARYWAKVADSFPSTTDPGVAGSNPFCSTIQSFNFRTCRRIDPNRRVCARFPTKARTRRAAQAALLGRRRQNLS